MPIFQYIALLIALIFTSSTFAQSPCDLSPWHCFGSFELKGKEISGTVRILRFSNNEFMAEIEENGNIKRLLKVQPSGLKLFYGLENDESPKVNSNNPFMFIDLFFAYPNKALQIAYPLGKNSVPVDWTEVNIDIERKVTATLRTTKLSQHKIKFHMIIDNGSIHEIHGVWDGLIKKPLPNDFSLAAWQFNFNKSITTLGQARTHEFKH